MKSKANPQEILEIALNGLYTSSNANLHKHRDYDPFLPNFVKLKQYLKFLNVIKILTGDIKSLISAKRTLEQLFRE